MKRPEQVIKRPHITEKSALRTEDQKHPAYTFVVDAVANKADVAHAIKALYKVSPVKVRMVTIPAKRVFIRGKAGMKSGQKKAVVYLKQGEKIAFA